VAISSHFLVGMQHRLPSQRGTTGWFSITFHRELRERTPVATIAGGSIRIYRSEDIDAAARQFQLTADERR